MPKYPKAAFYLRIGHLNVAVVPLSDKLAAKLLCEGFYDGRCQVIGVRQAASPEEQVRVLSHEIMHCIWDAFGLEDKPIDQETLCSAFDHAFAKLWMDNLGLLDKIKLAVGPEAASIF